MKKLSILLVGLCAVHAFAAGTAGRVVSYNVGDNPAGMQFTDSSAVLGEHGDLTTGGATNMTPEPPADYEFMISPYNAPYSTSELTGVTQNGSIVIELTNYANALAGQAEIGVYVAQMINTSATTPGEMFINGDQAAVVKVSQDGQNWVSLNGGEAISLNTPTTGYVFDSTIPSYDYTDWWGMGAGTAESFGDPSEYDTANFETPMDTADLDFSDATSFESSRAAAYGTSAGGNWLDISGTGLDSIAYISFDVAGDATDYLRLDCIYINADAVGEAIPEPATFCLLVLGATAGLLKRKK